MSSYHFSHASIYLKLCGYFWDLVLLLLLLLIWILPSKYHGWIFPRWKIKTKNDERHKHLKCESFVVLCCAVHQWRFLMSLDASSQTSAVKLDFMRFNRGNVNVLSHTKQTIYIFDLNSSKNIENSVSVCSLVWMC